MNKCVNCKHKILVDHFGERFVACNNSEIPIFPKVLYAERYSPSFSTPEWCPLERFKGAVFIDDVSAFSVDELELLEKSLRRYFLAIPYGYWPEEAKHLLSKVQNKIKLQSEDLPKAACCSLHAGGHEECINDFFDEVEEKVVNEINESLQSGIYIKGTVGIKKDE